MLIWDGERVFFSIVLDGEMIPILGEKRNVFLTFLKEKIYGNNATGLVIKLCNFHKTGFL